MNQLKCLSVKLCHPLLNHCCFQGIVKRPNNDLYRALLDVDHRVSTIDFEAYLYPTAEANKDTLDEIAENLMSGKFHIYEPTEGIEEDGIIKSSELKEAYALGGKFSLVKPNYSSEGSMFLERMIVGTRIPTKVISHLAAKYWYVVDMDYFNPEKLEACICTTIDFNCVANNWETTILGNRSFTTVNAYVLPELTTTVIIAATAAMDQMRTISEDQMEEDMIGKEAGKFLREFEKIMTIDLGIPTEMVKLYQFDLLRSKEGLCIQSETFKTDAEHNKEKFNHLNSKACKTLIENLRWKLGNEAFFAIQQYMSEVNQGFETFYGAMRNTDKTALAVMLNAHGVPTRGRFRSPKVNELVDCKKCLSEKACISKKGYEELDQSNNGTGLEIFKIERGKESHCVDCCMKGKRCVDCKASAILAEVDKEWYTAKESLMESLNEVVMDSDCEEDEENDSIAEDSDDYSDDGVYGENDLI